MEDREAEGKLCSPKLWVNTICCLHPKYCFTYHYQGEKWPQHIIFGPVGGMKGQVSWATSVPWGARHHSWCLPAHCVPTPSLCPGVMGAPGEDGVRVRTLWVAREGHAGFWKDRGDILSLQRKAWGHRDECLGLSPALGVKSLPLNLSAAKNPPCEHLPLLKTNFNAVRPAPQKMKCSFPSSLEDLVQSRAGSSSTSPWVSGVYCPASPGSTAALSINSENDGAY